MGKKITVANLICLVGAAVTLLFSFLNFYEVGDEGRNAWSGDIGAFATTVPALLAVAMLAWCICEVVGVNLPAQVLTYNSDQLKGTWGVAAAGIMLSWITVDFGFGADKGIGFWGMLLGSLAMATGAVMALLGQGTNTVNLGGGGGGDSSAVAPPPPPPGMTPPPPPPGP